MFFADEHPNGNFGKKRKSLQGDEKTALAVLLSDDTLKAHGYAAETTVEVVVGDVLTGEIAAVLLNDGRWFVGFISFTDDGVILSKGNDDYPPPFFRTDMIAACGRVVRRRRPAQTSSCVVTTIWADAYTPPFFLDHHPVMTWQTDARGTITHADDLCRQFLGLSEEQLRDGTWKNRIHPDDRAMYLRAREIAIAENLVYQNSVRVMDAGGKYRVISIVLAPIRGEAGVVTGWHAVAQLDASLIKRSA